MIVFVKVRYIVFVSTIRRSLSQGNLLLSSIYCPRTLHLYFDYDYGERCTVKEPTQLSFISCMIGEPLNEYNLENGSKFPNLP
jgi:hypothetical protein